MSKGWVLCHKCGKANIITCSAAAVFVTEGLYETKAYPTKENGDELTEHVGKMMYKPKSKSSLLIHPVSDSPYMVPLTSSYISGINVFQ